MPERGKGEGKRERGREVFVCERGRFGSVLAYEHERVCVCVCVCLRDHAVSDTEESAPDGHARTPTALDGTKHALCTKRSAGEKAEAMQRLLAVVNHKTRPPEVEGTAAKDALETPRTTRRRLMARQV
jgi:hypothetical protein